MGEEIERRTLHRLDYQDTYIWCRSLHGMLKTLTQTEASRAHNVIKGDKEQLLSSLDKIEKYLGSAAQGLQIKHQLELCQQALISMDDSDTFKDNLYCRDTDMFVEILKIMIAPPYGALRLIYQVSNIPAGWYPTIIRLNQLCVQATTDSAKLIELQTILSRQKDWRVIYEGVSLLGKVARTTQDEKISKQAVDGNAHVLGLCYYAMAHTFWSRCSPCCDKQGVQIRSRAQTEIASVTQDHMDGSLQQAAAIPLLERSQTLVLE